MKANYACELRNHVFILSFHELICVMLKTKGHCSGYFLFHNTSQQVYEWLIVDKDCELAQLSAHHFKKLMLDNEAPNEDEYITAWYVVPWLPQNPHGKD